jgi:hypothetical protein
LEQFDKILVERATKAVKKDLKQKGLLEESIESSDIGHDKFGYKKDAELERYKKKMIRPRELLFA